MTDRLAERCRAVVFDLDNTLYPLHGYIRGGCRAVADYIHIVYGIRVGDELLADCTSRAGIGPETEDDLCGIESAIAATLARHFRTVETQLLNRLAHVYRSHVPAIALYPDARMAIALMRARRLPLGLVPAGPSHSQRAKVEALGLEHLVDTIVYPSEMTGGNATTAAFRLAALQLDVPLHRTVYVSASADFQFGQAKKLGMITAFVERDRGWNSCSPGNADRRPDCDLTVPSPDAVCRLFTDNTGLAAA